MEENKIIKYKFGLIERISDVIGITNKLLRDLPISLEDKLIGQEQQNKQFLSILDIKKPEFRETFREDVDQVYFKFVGENNKRIVILIKEFTEEYIQPTSMEYLLNILRACQLELDDVAIINIAKEKIELSKIMNLLSPTVILLFGIKNTELNSSLDLTLNEIYTYENCKILETRALNLISGRSEKRELWSNLKRILNL